MNGRRPRLYYSCRCCGRTGRLRHVTAARLFAAGAAFIMITLAVVNVVAVFT